LALVQKYKKCTGGCSIYKLLFNPKTEHLYRPAPPTKYRGDKERRSKKGNKYTLA